MMLTPVWTENQTAKLAKSQQNRRRALGSPIVDITNRPAGLSPRASPKKPAAVLRRRLSSLSSSGDSGRTAQPAPPEETACNAQVISESLVEDITACIERTPALQTEHEVTARSDTPESDPPVSRSTAQRILNNRAVIRAQAKVAVDQRTPCATQIRDVLDVLLWAGAILLVIGMAVAFYQLTVQGHAHRVLFAVSAPSLLVTAFSSAKLYVASVPGCRLAFSPTNRGLCV